MDGSPHCAFELGMRLLEVTPSLFDMLKSVNRFFHHNLLHNWMISVIVEYCTRDCTANCTSKCRVFWRMDQLKERLEMDRRAACVQSVTVDHAMMAQELP